LFRREKKRKASFSFFTLKILQKILQDFLQDFVKEKRIATPLLNGTWQHNHRSSRELLMSELLRNPERLTKQEMSSLFPQNSEKEEREKEKNNKKLM